MIIKLGPLKRLLQRPAAPLMARPFSTDPKQKVNFNRPYEKPDFLDDDYDHLSKEFSSGRQTPADLEDDDFLPDYLAKDAPTFKRNEVSINLPWLINGAPFNEIKTRFMGEQIFSR